MTGFGAAALEEGGSTVRAEVRSVNHRFLQLKLRLPGDLAQLEPEVDAAVRKRVERGALSIVITLQGGQAAHPTRVDVEAARRYHAQLVDLARALDLEPVIRLDHLAALPGVIASTTDERELDRESKLLLRAVHAALDDLEEMREREGDALARDLAASATSIEGIVRRIAQRMPEAVRAHHEALHKRVCELVSDRSTIAETDLARELALLADRMDVSEELTRLDSHLGQLRVLLAKPGPVGRQLDFLVQEFLREANTVGSKCNDASVAHMVVELKTWIERLREQVQNIE